MENELLQLLLSGKIGDAAYVNQRKTEPKTYRVTFSNTKLDYIEHKEHVLNKFGLTTKRNNGCSGYNSSNVVYRFNSRITPETNYVGHLTTSDVIERLDISGLIYYYLDDGSLHKRKHFMNIYCNSFCVEDAQKLCDKINTLFPCDAKHCFVMWDKKSDGRKFPYVYIPKAQAALLSAKVYEFLVKNNITSLLYKTVEGIDKRGD